MAAILVLSTTVETWPHPFKYFDFCGGIALTNATWLAPTTETSDASNHAAFLRVRPSQKLKNLELKGP